LELAGNSTRVLFVLDFYPRGLNKLINGMIAKTMQSEAATVSKLKSVLAGDA